MIEENYYVFFDGADSRGSQPRYAAEIHRWFSAKSGSQEIATLFALERILAWYRDCTPESVCEVGHGIGTITYMLAFWRVGRVSLIAVEDNPWCIEQAKKNLGELAPVVLWYDKTPSYETFDFVVVDGPQIQGRHWERCLRDRAVVIFEGNRRGQRALMESVLRKEGRPFCRVNLKPLDRSKGVWVYQLEPTREERRHMWWSSMNESFLDFKARWRGSVVGKRRRV